MLFQRKKNQCILLIGILLLLSFFLLFLFFKKQPKGEYITLKEIETLTNLLYTVGEKEQDTKSKGENIVIDNDASYITYKQFKGWLSYMEEHFETLPLKEVNQISQKYRNSFYLLKEDWYSVFDTLCSQLGFQEEIGAQELIVLGDCQNTVDIEGNPIGEKEVFTQNGKWNSQLEKELLPWQKRASFVVYEDSIWGIRKVWEEAVLENAWIVENLPEEFRYFYKNYEIKIPMKKNSFEEREQIADLHFYEGVLNQVKAKKEKITGRVLKISPEELELEGLGIFPMSHNVQFYQLYGRLEAVGRNTVRLGYDFTDFIIEDGAIQAGLLVKDETMDHIRILIKNSDFDGNYHEEISCKSDVDMEILYGNQKEILPAGETIHFTLDSDCFTNSRVFLRPLALTGKTYFPNIKRNSEGQGYRGKFEIEKREEGLLLINEVLLEEYLYTVVPSEMPGYYPIEALKAQAICARTYAYKKLEKSSLSALGANMDDSSTYQVYNNIKENSNATKAVKETKGKLLYFGDQKADTYYYSTSCGFGTTGAIWNPEGKNPVPYLQSREMTKGKESYTGALLQEEEEFEQFITQRDTNHFESEEGWYRWSYENSNMDVIAEKIKKRQENFPAYVLTSHDGIRFSHNPIEDEFSILNIEVKKRGEGGTIEELLITTNQGQILVKNEYHIRAVLADGESRVHLQNDTSYACGNLLPSAFFVIHQEKEDGKVTKINLTGGGFGHGVGMSQNGAKNLAALGYDGEEILAFYYQECMVK